ncbi:uncharacterized protein [Chelonus insularis]|uniref:uncharacterized protein n=1 Tax=Chelonus insularis TaxID=460826 RepID=UPI00158AEA73|nr:uncharacterized protein LOC118074999 [Chelonus insularis]
MAGFIASCSDRARIIRTPFIISSYIDQLLSLIKNLNINYTQHPVEIINGSHLLSVVMQYINDDRITKSQLHDIQKLYEDCLKGLSKIISENVGEDLLPISKAVYFALRICIEGLRLNESFDENFSFDSETLNSQNVEKTKGSKLLREIIQFSFDIVIDVIIPNFQKIDEFQVTLSALSKSFVKCLTLLFTLEPLVDLKKLSYQLIIEKYLKYFLRQIQDPALPSENKSYIREFMAHIILIQAKNFLSVDKWSDGSTGFHLYINDGLSLLATNSVSTCDSSSMDALLLCLFLHYIYNLDENVRSSLREIPLIEKIVNFSPDNPPQILIIQITWFFLSVLLLEYDTIKSNKHIDDAIHQIILLLNKLGVESCYVHHPIILMSVFQTTIFPNEIRYQVVKLSLEAEPPITNIYETVGVENKNIVVASLMNSLLSGKGKVVERASEELNKIILEHNSIDFFITTLLWKELPQLLSHYEQDCEENVEKYLKLLCESSNDKLTNNMAIECFSKLLETLERDDIKINKFIECFIIILISKILALDSEANEKFVLLLIESKSFMQNLYKKTSNQHYDEISVASFICLALVIKNQMKFAITSKTIFSIDVNDLFEALLRKSSVSLAALKFWDAVWSSNMTGCQSININIEENETKTILPAIYREMLELFGRMSPFEWEFMFISLTNFFHFCRKNCSEVLRCCCDYPWTIRRINSVIKCKYDQQKFFEFAETWLRNALYCNSGCIEQALYDKQIRQVGYTSIRNTPSLFQTTVQSLNEYIYDLINTNTIEKENVEGLIQIISRII